MIFSLLAECCESVMSRVFWDVRSVAANVVPVILRDRAFFLSSIPRRIIFLLFDLEDEGGCQPLKSEQM